MEFLLVRLQPVVPDIFSIFLEQLLFRSLIDPFHATGLFIYPLKTSENQRFSDVFRGYRKRPVAWNELQLLSVVAFSRSNFRSQVTLRSKYWMNWLILPPSPSIYQITFDHIPITILWYRQEQSQGWEFLKIWLLKQMKQVGAILLLVNIFLIIKTCNTMKNNRCLKGF